MSCRPRILSAIQTRGESMFTTLARKTTSRRFWGTTATTVLLLMVVACNSGNSPTEPELPASAGSAQLGSIAVEVVPGPAVDIEKLTNGIDADTAPGPSVEIGQGVTWTFIVTNYGSVTLVEAVVEDDQIGRWCAASRISFRAKSGGAALAGRAIRWAVQKRRNRHRHRWHHSGLR